MNTTIDNQQETFKSYIAGLFEGEGSVMLTKINVRGKIIQLRGMVQFTNTEPELCQEFVNYLKQKNYTFHVRADIRKNRKAKICYQITINKAKDRLEFLKDMLPLFKGKKRNEAEYVIQFLERRVVLYNDYADRGKDGKYRSGRNSSFTEIDYKLYEDYKLIKDSPETTRKTPVFIG